MHYCVICVITHHYDLQRSWVNSDQLQYVILQLNLTKHLYVALRRLFSH